MACEIRVWGQLDVNGTEAEPVRFLAWATDSLVSTQPDLWWGIHVHDTTGAGAEIDHCVIRNARYGLSSNANLTIRNSTIEYCDVLGLSVAGGDSVYADSLTIHDVGYIGVNMNQGMRVRLNDCNLYNMADYGVKAYSGARLYANNTTINGADIEAISVEDDNTFAEIVDCTLGDNYRGLRVEDDAVASVAGSTIDANENYGVYSLYDAVVGLDGCTITNSDAGVAAYESAPVLIGNTVRDNEVGLLALQGAYPTVEDCDIIYNDIGVLAMQGGNPTLGEGGSWGNNEIHHNDTYHVSNLSSGVTVNAEDNYWKNSISPCFPISSKINGSVDYVPAICSPPTVSLRDPTEIVEIPEKYGLSQNYPNPFNPTTSIPYAVPAPGGEVTVALYNVRGQLVRTLVDDVRPPGFHAVHWDGTNNHGDNVSTGVYFVLMRAAGFRQTRKLVLLK